MGRSFLYAVNYGEEGVEWLIESEYVFSRVLFWVLGFFGGGFDSCLLCIFLLLFFSFSLSSPILFVGCGNISAYAQVKPSDAKRTRNRNAPRRHHGPISGSSRTREYKGYRSFGSAPGGAGGACLRQVEW